MVKDRLKEIEKQLKKLKETENELPDFPKEVKVQDTKEVSKSGKEFNKVKEVFYGRDSLRVFIINRQNRLDCAIVRVKDGFFTRNGKKYMVEADNIKYWKEKPYSFYSEANPRPLDYKFTHSEVDSKTLQTLLDTKFVKDMVSNPTDKIVVLVLCVLNTLGLAVILAKIFGAI